MPGIKLFCFSEMCWSGAGLVVPRGQRQQASNCEKHIGITPFQLTKKLSFLSPLLLLCYHLAATDYLEQSDSAEIQ